MRLGDLAKTAPLGADGRERLPPPPAPLSPVPHCRPPGPSPAGAHSPRGFSRTADGSGGDARWAARAALPGGRAPLGSGAALGTPALCLPRAFPPSCGVAGAGSGTPAGSRARGGPAGEEDLAEEEKAPPTPEPRPPSPAWGGQRRRAHGGRDGNVLRVQPGRKVGRRTAGRRVAFSIGGP
ncbi:hypothetical protein DBR06_SOUSAS7210064, partial [Sousa chinensis]